MSVMVRWRDVRPGDVVVLSGVDHEVVSVEGGLVRLGNGSSGRPGMSGYVEVVTATPAEALATVKERLGAAVLAVQDDGKPYRCPPVAMLDGDRVKFDAHLFAFHGGAEVHEVGIETIPHTH